MIIKHSGKMWIYEGTSNTVDWNVGNGGVVVTVSICIDAFISINQK